MHTVESKGPVEAIDIAPGLTPTTKKTTGSVTRSQETWPPQTSQKVVPPTKDQPRTWDPSTITLIRRPELLPSRSRFVFILMPIQGHRFVQGNANTLHKASQRGHLLHKIVGPVNCHII